MRLKSSVYVNSVLYSGGNILLQAFSFFLIPLYTAFLSTEQYGIINLANSFTAVLGFIIAFGLQFSVKRYYTEYKESRERVARMYSSAINFVIFFSLLVILVFLPSITIWSGSLLPGLEVKIVVIAVLIGCSSGLTTIYQDILKGMQQAKKSVLVTYVMFFLLVSMNIVAVVVLQLGATGILLSSLIGNIILAGYMFYDLKKQSLYLFCFDKTEFFNLVKYSAPLLPHTLAFSIYSYFARIIITSKLSLAILGLYSLATQFGNVSDIVLNSVQSAFQPWMFDRMKENGVDSKYQIQRTTHILMWLYGFMFILIGAYSQEAILIMADKNFAEAWHYVPIMVFSIALKSPLYFYNNFLYYEKSKTKYILYSTVVGSVLSILFIFALIPSLGVYGVILAEALAMLVRLAIAVYYTRKETANIYSLVKLELLSFIPMIFLAIAIAPSYLLFENKLSGINIAYKAIVFLIYALFFAFLYKDSIIPLIKKSNNEKNYPPLFPKF